VIDRLASELFDYSKNSLLWHEISQARNLYCGQIRATGCKRQFRQPVAHAARKNVAADIVLGR
jgi:hypothetical protein